MGTYQGATFEITVKSPENLYYVFRGALQMGSFYVRWRKQNNLPKISVYKRPREQIVTLMKIDGFIFISERFWKLHRGRIKKHRDSKWRGIYL